MSNFEFVSHEEFPEDKYVQEIVYLAIDGKYRIGFVNKRSQAGGAFWDTMGCSATENGVKRYFKGIRFSDNFLHDDILAFLKNRAWEKGKKANRNFEAAELQPPPF